jgi:acyl-CoA synthetase (AMP-forming)/AMP-acid ligase II
MANAQDKTLEQMCQAALERDPALPALEFDDVWTSWGELRRMADRLSAALRASGAPAHAPIAFVPRNHPQAVGALLGMLAAGHSVRMVYAFQSATGIARDLARLEPALVVAAAQEFSPEVKAMLRVHGSAAVALTGLTGMEVSPLEGFEKYSGPGSVATPPEPEIQILTSGTTGAPKRFGMTHALIARDVVGGNKNYQPGDDDVSRDPPLLQYFPLGNISGIYGILPPLLRGHRVVLLERFTVPAWRNYVRRHQPARASLPPAGFQMVLDADVPPEELAAVRCIATGSAPLDADVHRAFVARYKIPVLVSYGATEFAGPVTAMTLELHKEWGEKKLGSVGRPIGGARLRVVDPLTGSVLGPNQEGILEVITPRIGPDWIRTSDRALIDEDGFLFHRGRADGAIMRGGFKLLPEAIERALLLHPSVSAAAVIGLPDARLGQVPAAVVEIRAGALHPAVCDLELHLRDHVYATHIPVAWRLVDQLPRTAALKIDGLAVRSLFETPA